MNLRFRFSKGEPAKFLSHLDLARSFQRALRRADVKVAYSQGFNPHPKIAFALALPVGQTSQAELVEVVLAQPEDPEALMARINQTLPLGIRLLKGVEAPVGAVSLNAAIDLAAYSVRLHHETDLGPAVETLLSQESVMVEREGKKGLRSMDVRGWIHRLHAPGQGVLEMVVASGSQGNLRPDEVLTLLGYTQGRGIERTGLYARGPKGEWIDPLTSEVCGPRS